MDFGQQPSGSAVVIDREATGRRTGRRGVLVVGMHRSGTSAVAGLLSLLGLALPRTRMGPGPANQGGHWGESERIRSLHDELLASAGSSWDDVSPFPAAWLRSPRGEELRARMVELVRTEYSGSAPFVLKDPRICRLLPFWLLVLEELRVRPAFVLPIRNPLEVAASLSRRDGFGRPKGLLLWLRHVLDAERDTRGRPRAFVSYPDLLRDWRPCARAISDGIGLELTAPTPQVEAELERFLSADRRHFRFSIDELNARGDAVAWVKEAYAILLDACRAGRAPDPVRMDALSGALAEADLAYGPVLAEASARAENFRASLRTVAAERRDLAERVEAREAALRARSRAPGARAPAQR